MPIRSILAFALIGLAFSILSIFFLDYALAPKVLALGKGDEALWHFITDIGDSKYMGILLVLIGLTGFILAKLRPDNAAWPALWKKALLISAVVSGTGIFILVVKFIVGRARPYMGDIGFHPFTYGSDFASWPSAHTTSAFAFAMTVGMAFPILRWPLFALASLTGFSRMVLGVHYLGDVIMGATIGTLGAVLIHNWLRPKLMLT
ncbi:MAG: phosphatase PAP2 family protein [Rhodobacteraceae bacterium]|nr:phosphatase PAP2 family protein [Paracoccaceae bacterium]